MAAALMRTSTPFSGVSRLAQTTSGTGPGDAAGVANTAASTALGTTCRMRRRAAGGRLAKTRGGLGGGDEGHRHAVVAQSLTEDAVGWKDHAGRPAAVSQARGEDHHDALRASENVWIRPEEGDVAVPAH